MEADPVDLSEEYRALLRRDWAVRVLDAYAKTLGNLFSWETTYVGVECWDVEFTDPNRDRVKVWPLWDNGHLTPEAARHAAAQVLYTALDAVQQAELGECP